MATTEENQIPIDAPKADFERFLAAPDNKRIFFSGRFGIGKTYFLQQFFADNGDKYDVYHLFPIRYQLASTENIVELLKYDVLVELLKKYPDAFTTNDAKGASGWLKLFGAFAKDRDLFRGFLQSSVSATGDVLSLSPDPFIQAISKLGRPLNDLLELDKEFQAFKKEYLSGDKGAVETFLAKIEAEGDPVATDYIGHLLRGKIAELKGTEKRGVLVLDDFDRVDPEHIFRILNVMSVHMNDDDENKFGFDHVVIVGDVDNIKNIFHHKYGADTDFAGYFDKFFTIRPYHLGTKHIAERVSELVKQVMYAEPSIKDAIGDNGYIKLLLSEVLTRSLAINKLNLRQLYRPLNHLFQELQKGVYSNDPFRDSFHHLVDVGIQVLVAIFGGAPGAFVKQLEAIRASIQDDEERTRTPYEAYIGAMMKDLITNGNLKGDQTVMWGKYPFKTPADLNARGFSIEGSPAHRARFFYDALIEYVRTGKYIKDNHRDYDR
ncbi:MAG: hypothetical protein B7X04_03260 [Parcubacteria group bacterium 21-54-25]|nr:MAG: hypothetical protein B7X04_03260 [Parcubacteria group bacterium 21-54-25]HQU08007.1 P-loop NTPase fold protein [Candidatus Paceibacterota bacterium]